MKIKKSNAELEQKLEQIKTLIKQKIELPSKTSYAIIKNKIAIERALEPFVLSRDEIIKNKAGGKTSVSAKDDPKAFNEICEAINEIALELPEVEISTIKLSDIAEREMPLSAIDALSFMIEEG